MILRGDVLVQGAEARGPAFALAAPISFWGGVDPSSGSIIDARHPDRGRSVAGTILCLPGTIGSSSASSVMLELVANGHAPAALLVHQPDAILLLGLIVAREMGWTPPPALQLDAAHFPALVGRTAIVRPDGTVRLSD